MSNPFNPSTPVAEVRQFQVVDTETIVATRNLIERKGRDLAKLKAKKKLIKEREQSMLENNTELQEAEAAALEHVEKVKAITKQIKESPEAARLRILKKETATDEKELESELSNHLVNYRMLVGTNVFETEDGREIEFKTNGKFTSKQLSQFLEGEDQDE